ncbi:MAG: hypothetical protein Q7U83_14195, partial [Daejeonella sp.]|nr:hypothetical protein [Daejeonella sp.]
MKNLVLLFLSLNTTFSMFSVNVTGSLPKPVAAKDSIIYDYKLTDTIQCEGLYPMHLQGIST